MSKFDGNPFEDDDTTHNPYASGGGGKSSSKAAPTASFFDNVGFLGQGAMDDRVNSSTGMMPLPPESRTGSAYGVASDVPFSPKSLKRKQKELQAKEAELRRKERELSAREENLGLNKANWPPFFPIIRHDIREDIPEYLQSMQRVAFFSWLGAMWCLLWNFVCVIVAWASGATSFFNGMVAFFIALIFILLGYPVAFFMWYRRLYNSLKNDSTIGLVLFFISYCSHILWFILFAIAPPIFVSGVFMTGVLTTLGFFAGGAPVVGILYTIGCASFIGEVALSIWVLGQVYSYFRGAGKANQLRKEAAMAALRSAV